MASGAIATFAGAGVAIFLFIIIFSWVMILITYDKRKIIVRRRPSNSSTNSPRNTSPSPIGDSPTFSSSSSRSYSSMSPEPLMACGFVLPSRPDFSTLPSDSVVIQSIGPTNGPITIFRGGYVDVITSSLTGNDVILRVPSGEGNTRGTTIRVSNSGRLGDIVFTPISTVVLCSESDSRVKPLTTGYFIALDSNFYARLPST